MPHIIVEYTDGLSIDIDSLLSDLHNALAKDPSVEKARIKTRALPLKFCIVGEDDAPNEMFHITLRLLPRPDEARENMAEKLHKIASEALHKNHPDCVITAETCELHAHSYCT